MQPGDRCCEVRVLAGEDRQLAVEDRVADGFGDVGEFGEAVGYIMPAFGLDLKGAAVYGRERARDLPDLTVGIWGSGLVGADGGQAE